MALPKQVQAQANAVAEFDKSLQQPPAADPGTPQPEGPNAQAAPPQQVQEPAQPVVEPTKPQEDPEPTWRQRYLSLQGQFNKLVPALQGEVSDLKGMVADLQVQLQKAQTASPAPAPEPAVSEELVTKQDVEVFGEDLVNLARRVAKEESGKREGTLRQQISELQSQLAEAKGQVGEVAQNQALTAQQRFFKDLQRALPTWETVQATSECQAWLATRIPGTPATWDQALKDAAGRRDVDAVMEVFSTFFDKHPALNPNAPAPAKPTSSTARELERQVAPTRTAASAQPQAKTVYSAAEYERESMRLVRLMREGKRDESVQLQAELDAALAEGRIRP